MRPVLCAKERLAQPDLQGEFPAIALVVLRHFAQKIQPTIVLPYGLEHCASCRSPFTGKLKILNRDFGFPRLSPMAREHLGMRLFERRKFLIDRARDD